MFPVTACGFKLIALEFWWTKQQQNNLNLLKCCLNSSVSVLNAWKKAEPILKRTLQADRGYKE